MTAMPWGQKKRRREMIQSQTVTPPLAAIEGTTFRLKTATTNRSTRSRRPSARIRWGWAADWVVVDKFFGNASLRLADSHGCRYVSGGGACRGGRMRPALRDTKARLRLGQSALVAPSPARRQCH